MSQSTKEQQGESNNPKKATQKIYGCERGIMEETVLDGPFAANVMLFPALLYYQSHADAIFMVTHSTYSTLDLYPNRNWPSLLGEHTLFLSISFFFSSLSSDAECCRFILKN